MNHIVNNRAMYNPQSAENVFSFCHKLIIYINTYYNLEMTNCKLSLLQQLSLMQDIGYSYLM